jgi:hypothetical protein
MKDYIENIPSAWQGHRLFAEWLVEQYQNPLVVDLGVDYGYSTFCFATSKNAKVIGIDAFLGDKHAGFRNTYDDVLKFKNDHNFDNVNIVKGFFDEIAVSFSESIDILHIDGLHTYEAVSNDFNTWKKFLKSDGIILFHDVAEFKEVKQFFNELVGEKLYFTQSCGLGITSQNTNLLKKISEMFPNSHQGNIK